MSNLMYREKKFQKINLGLLLLLGVVTGYCAMKALNRGDHYAAFQASLALAMYTFPALITHFLHFYIPQDCRLLYFIFTFCTVVVGSAMYGYSRIPYWDKLFHFFSGILISAVGFIVCFLFFHRLSGERRVRYTLYIMFPFLFNLSVAVLWEIYEYLLYILLGIDAVNNLATGVNDTMQDIIVCFLGGTLFTCSVFRSYLSGKHGPVLKICVHFLQLHVMNRND